MQIMRRLLASLVLTVSACGGSAPEDLGCVEEIAWDYMDRTCESGRCEATHRLRVTTSTWEASAEQTSEVTDLPTGGEQYAGPCVEPTRALLRCGLATCCSTELAAVVEAGCL